VSLGFVGGEGSARPVPQASGREQFERVVGTLEGALAGGDARVDRALLDRAFDALDRGSRRGAIMVLLSDLLDLPEDAAERVAALSSRGRVVVVVQVLDPDEATFPFEGTMRLRAMEGDFVVETEAETTRARYLAALEALQDSWDRALTRRGARFVRAVTTDDPVRAVRAVVSAAR
jgi:hypothetical protein